MRPETEQSLVPVSNLLPSVHLIKTSKRRFSPVVIANADSISNFIDENLPIADLARAGSSADRCYHFFGTAGRDHYLDFQLGQQIDVIFLPAVRFLVPLLPAVPLNLINSQAIDSQLLQGAFDF